MSTSPQWSPGHLGRVEFNASARESWSPVPQWSPATWAGGGLILPGVNEDVTLAAMEPGHLGRVELDGQPAFPNGVP